MAIVPQGCLGMTAPPVQSDAGESPLQPLHQIARRLGISTTWLAAEAASRRVPALKTPAGWMGVHEAVLAALMRRATEYDRLLLRVDEVAWLLGISERSVWRAVSAGELPKPQRIGKQSLWHRPTLERFIEARQRQADLAGAFDRHATRRACG